MSNYSGEKRYQKDGEKRYQKDGEKRYQKDGEKRYQKDGEKRYQKDGEKRCEKDGEKRYQKDGEKKHCAEKSRRYDGEIPKCTAAEKGKCNRKDCKFAPCCYKNGNAVKPVAREEKSEIYYEKSSDSTYYDYDSYVQPANTGYLLPIYKMSNEEYYMQEQLTNYYYGITTTAPVAAAVATVAAAPVVVATVAAAPVVVAVAVAPVVVAVAVAPVAVAVAPVTPGSFTFTQADFARFMMLFNVNCRDLNKLTEMFPEFEGYITNNNECFYANINHFINVINGSVPLNTAAVWVQKVFNRGYLNLDSFKGGKCGEANIR